MAARIGGYRSTGDPRTQQTSVVAARPEITAFFAATAAQQQQQQYQQQQQQTQFSSNFRSSQNHQHTTTGQAIQAGATVARQLDISAMVAGPRTQHPHDSPRAIQRRMAYLQQRQAAYDSYCAAPRVIPAKLYDEHEFMKRMDSVMQGNELTQKAAQKVTMHEAMLKQKAHTRHFDWTKRVYEPIQASVAEAVDTNFEKIHAARTDAMTGYLATTAARNVYLDDLVKPGDYDPYALTRTSGIRTKVHVLDPLKRVVDKTWEELELVRRPTFRKPRTKDMLPARLWTKEAVEAMPHGHFEAKDLAGGMTMAFAGKDNESSVSFLDYDAPLPRDASTGRQRGVDAEFPIGKRITPYPYRFQDSSHTVAHPNVTKHIYSPGERFDDGGGARLDSTIADVMRNAK